MISLIELRRRNYDTHKLRREEKLEIVAACQAARLRAEYTQADLARIIGYTHPAISMFERGMSASAVLISWYDRLFNLEEVWT